MGLAASVYAGMQARLLPPGRLWHFLDAMLTDLLLGAADELARLDARGDDLLREAEPSTATELLPEFERELGLDEAPTIEERRARVVARTVARQRYRPVDFRISLAPLLGQEPDDVVVIETSHAAAAAMGDDREIFRFFIYRDPSLPGDYFIDSAQAQVDKIKPSHTKGHVIESIDFLCDDSFSLCDRDLLGA